MSNDDRIDPQQLRMRVIQRLEPQLRLQRQKYVLFGHIALFVVILSVIFSAPISPFWQSIVETYDGGSYTVWQPYPLTIGLGLLWFGLLIVHAGWVFMNHMRERLIRREMDREYALEKLRLEVELAQAQGTPIPGAKGIYRQEKPKRQVRLTDDGELAINDSDDPFDAARASFQRRDKK